MQTSIAKLMQFRIFIKLKNTKLGWGVEAGFMLLQFASVPY